MANFVDCYMKDIDILTLLSALFAKDAGGHYPFRVVTKTKDAGDPIACKSKEQFRDLLRMAVELADDNKPALRICVTDYADGATLTDVPPCANAEDLELFARFAFCYDTNGDVCVALANIT